MIVFLRKIRVDTANVMVWIELKC